MKTATLQRTRQVLRAWLRSARWLGAGLMIGLAGMASLPAATVTTLGGGPGNGASGSAGYVNGSTKSQSQFNLPAGLALSTDNTLLFVADQNNNAVRELELNADTTLTFTSTKISAPVGVLVDFTNNVYVLNRGNGKNGTILKFDRFTNFKGTNAYQLTNATAMAMDGLTNIYVTVQSNTIIKVAPNGAVSTVAVISGATITSNSVVTVTHSAQLMGIAVMPNGSLAVTDAKNNGIWMVNPVSGSYSQLTGFNGAGEQYGDPTDAQFYQPYGIAYAGGGMLVVTDYGNDRVVTVDPNGIVEIFYGIPPSEWFPGEDFPGWFDGENCDNAYDNCAEARNPYGVVVDQAGNVYTTEVYYDIIRETTGTGLAGPGTTLGVTPLFNNPGGIALQGSSLYIADRNNNSVDLLNLGNNTTTTFAAASPTNGINNPSGVAFDSFGNLYVLNEGTGANGSIIEYSQFGRATATNATGLATPTALTVDQYGDIFVAEQNGTVLEFSGGTSNVVAVIPNPGVDLEGIALFDDGTIAVSDAGNQVIWAINPGTDAITQLAGTLDQPGSGLGQAGQNYLDDPHQLALASGDQLLVADTGNDRIAVVTSAGAITNVLVSTNSQVWFGRTGDPYSPSAAQWVPIASPIGVAIGANGTVFDSEDTDQLIRGTLATGLTPPPPPVPSPAPIIGEVIFEDVSNLVTTMVTSSNGIYVLNNTNVSIAIEANGSSSIYYNIGSSAAGVATPSNMVGFSAAPYIEGSVGLPPSIVNIAPVQFVKAVGVIPGDPDSPIVQAEVEYVTANPVITGNNAAQFSVASATANASLYYTLDGSDPTNSSVPPSTSIGPITNNTTLSLVLTSNTTFKVRAFYSPNGTQGFAPSGVASTVLLLTNYVANSITFGFASGEASSDFVASPGQFFYAPITLSVLPATEMYSLQFDMSVTNELGAPGIVPGQLGFQSMLVQPNPSNNLYYVIPPAMALTNVGISGYYPANPATFTNNGTPFVSLEVITNDLIGVGWLERVTQDYLYNTVSQDLIQYSLAHDTLFLQSGGKVVVGGFAFLVPSGAAPGNTYQIQLTRPSATSDGIGAPGSEVYIATPTNGSLSNGAINSIKLVRIGVRKYIVGDCAPFRWFNAGDFGDGYLLNDDVEQVFQSAMYYLNYPPPGSDFYDSMDSCCGGRTTNADRTFSPISPNDSSEFSNSLYLGDDSTINNISFGDGKLDVTDVYVTFRRSLDPGLTWFDRYHTNGALVAEVTTNTFPSSNGNGDMQDSFYLSSPTAPAVSFYAGDAVGGAGQTLQIPITARTEGSYPLRVLALNLTVVPLDGSPPITAPVQFTPDPTLGSPVMTDSHAAANYAAAWLDSTIPGLSTNATIGTLSVTVPAGAGPKSAYAIHFDHASGSPNGLASFPVTANTGVLTTTPRNTSYFNDGIPDVWRLRHFGTVSNLLSQASADADGDGANNWQEYEAGTDPNNAQSVFKAAYSLGTNAPECDIQWPTAVGIKYVVQISSSLYGTNWTTLTTNAGTGFNLQFHDTTPGTGPRFYRVTTQ